VVKQAVHRVRKAAGPIKLISRRRKWIAFAVAAVSDIARAVFAPLFVEGATSPLDMGVDAATALLILLIVGWDWRLAIALVVELVPGVALFPTWTAVVLSLPAETVGPVTEEPAPHAG
jgi:hypothetical protein